MWKIILSINVSLKNRIGTFHVFENSFSCAETSL